MQPNRSLNRYSAPALLLLLAGLLTLVSSGRFTIPLAAWIAPAFAMLYLDVMRSGNRGRRSIFLLYLITWIALSIAWYNATPIFGVAQFVFMAFNALIGLLPLLADFWLTPRLAQGGRLPFLSTLIYPTAATAIEFLTLGSSPFGNFGAAGYSQFGFAPFMQIAAWGGMFLQAFVLAWFAALVVWVVRASRRSNFAWGQLRSGLAIAVAAYALLFGAAIVRLATATAAGSGTTAQIAAFTLNSPDLGTLFAQAESDRAAFAATTAAQRDAYLARSAEAAAAGANIILWPEAAAIGLADDIDALIAEGAELARAHGLYLAMPTVTLFPDEDRPMENRLIVVDPEGNVVINHIKYGGNMIEGSLAGSGELQTVDTPFGTLSGVICWDTDFPQVIRQAGQQGVDILLSPARDFAGIDPLHGEMAAFRAVENGMTVVRQSDSGLSIISDAYGRTLATRAADDSTTLRVAVPSQGVATLYAQLGDVAGVVSTVAFVLLAGWALVAGRRKRAVEMPQAQAQPSA